MTDLETVKEWALQDRENGISLGEDDYEVFLQYCNEAGIKGNWDLFDYYLNVVEGIEDDVDESLDLRKPDRILEGMTPDQFRYLSEIAESIGIYTLGDLEKFLKTEFPESNGVIDDNTVEYLIQYKKELGPDFKIREYLEEDDDDMTDLELAERLDKALKEGSDHEKGNDRKCCEVDPESSVVDPDNSIIDCKKYTVVAHCDDEAPVDCNMKKPPLEKPLTEEVKTPTGRMTACLNSVNNKIAQLVDEIKFAEDLLKKDFEKDSELEAKFHKVLNSMIVDIIGIDAARSVESTKISEPTDDKEELNLDLATSSAALDESLLLEKGFFKNLFGKKEANSKEPSLADKQKECYVFRVYTQEKKPANTVEYDSIESAKKAAQSKAKTESGDYFSVVAFMKDEPKQLVNKKDLHRQLIYIVAEDDKGNLKEQDIFEKFNHYSNNLYDTYIEAKNNGQFNKHSSDLGAFKEKEESEKAEEPAKVEPAKEEPTKIEPKQEEPKQAEPAEAPEEASSEATPTKERSEKQKAVTAKMSQQKKSTKAVFDALVKSGLMSQEDAKAAAQNEKDDATGKTKFNTSKIAKFKKELADTNGKIELVASAQGEVQNFSDALLENID